MNARRTVLRVITRMNVGGPSRHVRLLMRGLPATVFEQKLVVGTPARGEEEFPWVDALQPLRVAQLVRQPSPWHDFSALSSVERIIRDLRPAIVHSHQAKAGLIARLAARRVGGLVTVHTFHGHTFEGYWGRMKGRILLGVERWLARRTTALIAQSESQAVEIGRHLGSAVRGRLHVIPPAVDPEVIDDGATTVEPAVLRERWQLEGCFVIAWVGRITEVKDPGALLRILARARNRGATRLAVLVVGGGSEAAERAMQDEIDALDLRPCIRWLGVRRDVASVYRVADLVVMTSRNEGTPQVVLESLAFGTPVMAFDVGGIRDLEGDGSLVERIEPRNEEAFAQRLLAAIARGTLSPGTREAEGQRLRREFAPERLCERMVRLYDALDRST